MAGQSLTKSRLKIGWECPTKLSYQDDRRFGNLKTENSFLEALAEGGFQVGELAKLYFPGGTEISERNKERAFQETQTLLKSQSAIIYEAAFQFQNLFIKADIVSKQGNRIELIEVKAKSIDAGGANQFYSSRPGAGELPFLSEWQPYLIDVAFQKYVALKAFPEYEVSASLMLADKTATASVDGLNQKFFLVKTEGEFQKVKVAEGTSPASVGSPILRAINVDQEIDLIWNHTFRGLPFEKWVLFLSEICRAGKYVSPKVGVECKGCEFRIGKDMKAQGLESGFDKCWSETLHLSPEELQRRFIFDIWDFRKSDEMIEQGKIFAIHLDRKDLEPKTKSKSKPRAGLSRVDRQWLQVEKIRSGDPSSFIDTVGLKSEFDKFVYPLHFIDFETTMAAIPFHKGMRPYEQIAFQFSHHIVERDGSIRHANEYINSIRGAFPNFEFLRALKSALEKDEGTIFRYATHENTVLCQIREQLKVSDEPDAQELIAFVQTITRSPEKSKDIWEGRRCMIDLCDLVKSYFYDPAMGGSNSIKKVLPAILNSSKFLQEKYARPIYGSKDLPSKNFSPSKIWVEMDKLGRPKDPYSLLGEIFDDLDVATMDSLISDDSIADGGAAMTAYSRMQFTEMSDAERERVTAALLRYCELDTFAMVMIWEHWANELLRCSSGAA